MRIFVKNLEKKEKGTTTYALPLIPETEDVLCFIGLWIRRNSILGAVCKD